MTVACDGQLFESRKAQASIEANHSDERNDEYSKYSENLLAKPLIGWTLSRRIGLSSLSKEAVHTKASTHENVYCKDFAFLAPWRLCVFALKGRVDLRVCV